MTIAQETGKILPSQDSEKTRNLAKILSKVAFYTTGLTFAGLMAIFTAVDFGVNVPQALTQNLPGYLISLSAGSGVFGIGARIASRNNKSKTHFPSPLPRR